MTRKVRRYAERSGYGAIRHVEASRPTPLAWAIATLLYTLALFAVWDDGEPFVGFLAVGSFYTAVIGGIISGYSGEKFVVLDRGVLIGSFSLFLKPFAVPFEFLDARTVRTSVCTARPISAMRSYNAFNVMRTSLWSRRNVSFVGLAPPLCRALMAGASASGFRDPRAAELWVFPASSTRGQQRAAAALIAALRDAGVPGVELSEMYQGQTRRIRARREDADFLCLPELIREPAFVSQPAPRY